MRNRAANNPLPIRFNSKGKAVGPNKKLFVSFVALQGRMRACITISEWEAVEEGVKNQIWEAIRLTFEVPNDPVLRRKWIGYAGSRWTGFKTFLTSTYIFGARRGQDPTVKYKWIETETWKKFVLSRQDPVFLERRRKAQEIQACNDCPHRLSWGGYELLEEKMMAEKLELQQEASKSDSSVLLKPPSPIKRHHKWKRGRIGSNGQYTSKTAREIAEKISTLEQEENQGTFVPLGRDDILTTAIGRPEHPGRVRAVGAGVGIREVFPNTGRQRNTSPALTKHDVDLIKKEVRDEVTQEVTENLSKMFDQKLRDELLKLGFNTHQEPHREVHNLGATIQHQKIAADFVRVEVVEVIDALALVPIATDEVQTVGQAPKQFIQWPRRLINPNKDKRAYQKDDDNDQVDVPNEHKDPIARLLEMTKHLDGQPLELVLKGDVIGVADISLFLSSEEIMEMCSGNQMLSTKVMRVWIMYLHKLCTKKNNKHLYGFFDPHTIQDVGNKRDETQTYILTHIKDNKDCYLVPYYYPNHWQLFVLCPKQNLIVFLCSLGNKPKTNVKSVFDMAMQAHQITKNRRNSKPRWIKPISRMQRGSYESGYYVMRHMETIISAVVVDSWIETFNVQESFSPQDITETREHWASFVCDTTSSTGFY
ncbi:unnamed protein product [Cuscuta europaea]|uniref:DUF8039 domain-containing protein n=1 Tax=Cuscuta europaea TaxID=41803 RepID=A0A9P1EE35_CUSEU|nr:unnamed protein product [Cuscuta europaea]